MGDSLIPWKLSFIYIPCSKKKAELWEVNRLAVFTLLILGPVPCLFLTSFLLLQLLWAQVRLFEFLLCSSTWMWEELKRDHGLCSFPSAGCASLFANHNAAAKGCSLPWNFMAYLQWKPLWGQFLYSAGRAQPMFTRVTFLASKSRVSLRKIVCWKQYLPVNSLQQVWVWLGRLSVAQLQRAQAHTDSRALTAEHSWQSWLRPESSPNLVSFTSEDLPVQPSIPTRWGRKKTLLAKVSRTPS